MQCRRNRSKLWRNEGKPEGLWPAAPSSRSIHHAHGLGALELARSLPSTHPIHYWIAMASTLPCSCSGSTANSSPALLQPKVHLHLGQPKAALNRQHGRRLLVTLAAKKAGTTQWSLCKWLEFGRAAVSECSLITCCDTARLSSLVLSKQTKFLILLSNTASSLNSASFSHASESCYQ